MGGRSSSSRRVGGMALAMKGTAIDGNAVGTTYQSRGATAETWTQQQWQPTTPACQQSKPLSSIGSLARASSMSMAAAITAGGADSASARHEVAKVSLASTSSASNHRIATVLRRRRVISEGA